MKSMDRNTVIGFVLLAVLLFAYLFNSTKNSNELEGQRLRVEDSLAQVVAKKQAAAVKSDTVSVAKEDTSTAATVFNGTESKKTLENEVFSVVFSNKGGQPVSVILKKYKSLQGGPLQMVNAATDKFSYAINTGNQSGQVSDLFFDEGQLTSGADGSQSLVYTATMPDGRAIVHQYTIRKDNYLIDWNVLLKGADKLLTQGAFNFNWIVTPVQHESDVQYERSQSNICFLEDNDFDYILSKTEKKFEKPVQWVGVAQQFFNTTIIAQKSFNSGEVKWVRETADSADEIATVNATLQAKLPLQAQADFPMQIYYGPNSYKILQNAAPEMDKMVNLGRDMYAFVRPINKYIILPVFSFFKSFIGSFGLVIALLTLFIRLLTSPLVYTSYLSGAKMKALRPELEILKKKYPDQQTYGMEQMKLFREAGVNPLGGCIPALLQIPIFFALYSFFNSNIDLRGQAFLWAENLASYDVIARLPFSIPLNYGDHVSLFTITAVVTSFLISIYNMNMTPDQNNPALKYMPYIFPFILLFIFNKLPAALTWYYTVSNIITLILQWVIQNYIIDHSKILAKLEENKKKPKTKSKWAERLEQMQEQQKKMKDARK
ncbi:MAG: membrane protein insertase YidC [Gemmatimonadaceae bacterium]|nr:membrane protein insertase YidC [Chitinophagaceae bacterium]